MYTHAFRYLRAKTLAEAEAAFGDGTESRYLAGGQSLIPMMKLRLAAPTELIDIARIAELRFISLRDGKLAVGACTPHAEVNGSRELQSTIPALAELAGLIGDPAVRHRGTIGGSVAHNDPAADYPAALLALNAEVTTTRRTLGAEAFFTGMFSTGLADGELVTSIAFPRPRRAGYVKFRNPASRYAMVGVFVAETRDGIRVAVTGAGPCVFRAPEMEAALTHKFEAKAIAGISVSPERLSSDLHGSAEYRAHLVTVIAGRAVAKALGEAHG